MLSKRKKNIVYLLYNEKFTEKYIEVFNFYLISKYNIAVIFVKKITVSKNKRRTSHVTL